MEGVSERKKGEKGKRKRAQKREKREKVKEKWRKKQEEGTREKQTQDQMGREKNRVEREMLWKRENARHNERGAAIEREKSHRLTEKKEKAKTTRREVPGLNATVEFSVPSLLMSLSCLLGAVLLPCNYTSLYFRALSLHLLQERTREKERQELTRAGAVVLLSQTPADPVKRSESIFSPGSECASMVFNSVSHGKHTLLPSSTSFSLFLCLCLPFTRPACLNANRQPVSFSSPSRLLFRSTAAHFTLPQHS